MATNRTVSDQVMVHGLTPDQVMVHGLTPDRIMRSGNTPDRIMRSGGFARGGPVQKKRAVKRKPRG